MNQCGLKSQTALKSRSVYMAISLGILEISHPFQKFFHLHDDFTGAIFQTIVKFYCTCKLVMLMFFLNNSSNAHAHSLLTKIVLCNCTIQILCTLFICFVFDGLL